MGDPRVCARGHLEPPGALCLCTDGSETGGIFPVEGKVWVGREVILDLWDLQLPLGVILRLPFWGQAPDVLLLFIITIAVIILPESSIDVTLLSLFIIL